MIRYVHLGIYFDRNDSERPEAGVEVELFLVEHFWFSCVTGSFIQRFVVRSFRHRRTASSAPNSPEQVRMWCSPLQIIFLTEVSEIFNFMNSVNCTLDTTALSSTSFDVSLSALSGIGTTYGSSKVRSFRWRFKCFGAISFRWGWIATLLLDLSSSE